MKTLLTIGGVPVFIEASDSQERVVWTAGFTVDGDGSPRCYGPPGVEPLDYLANAGRPGNWWGLATHNRKPSGKPIIQGGADPCPSFYVSMTAYEIPAFRHGDPRRYVNSEEIVFSVVPSSVLKRVKGRCKGCQGKITDLKTGLSTASVIADVGPADHLGEASIAAARFFGLNPSPKNGGSPDKSRFFYEMWPGLAAEGYNLQSG